MVKLPQQINLLLETFKTIIDDGGYSHEQMFNMDETGHFLKRMPLQTFIMMKLVFLKKDDITDLHYDEPN